jgi:hypothetical protein
VFMASMFAVDRPSHNAFIVVASLV